MSVLTTRGGVPRIQRAVIDATGRRYTPGGAHDDPAVGRYSFITQHLQIYNTTANPVNLFFLESDFAANDNFITIGANGLWEGPVELDAFWLKSAAGTTVAIVAYQRRS